MYIFSNSIYFDFLTDNNQTNMDIYNEDEEMKENEEESEHDSNNDESSEDEVEFDINEYEKMMIESSKSDEEDNNNEKNDNNEEDDSNEENGSDMDLDEKVVIDKSFSNKQMPQIFSEFAPYFKNITEALLFC